MDVSGEAVGAIAMQAYLRLKRYILPSGVAREALQAALPLIAPPSAARELALDVEFATIRAMIYCYEGDSAQAFEAQKALAKIDAAIRTLSSQDHADAGKVEGDGWLPIESAPKDGTWFLAYRPEPDGGTWDRLCIVCWSAEEDDFVWPDDTFDIYRDDLSDMDDRGFLKFDTYSSCGSFTHWRPLPSAPSEGAE